jgi:hypothetical protein
MTTKPRQNPMHRLPDWHVTMPLAHACLRCGARTRRGIPCRSPAMSNTRCRMHGGASTGPRTLEGLQRIARARTVHGGYSAESCQVAALIRGLKAETRRLLVELT